MSAFVRLLITGLTIAENAYNQVNNYERAHPMQSQIARTAVIGAGIAVAAPLVAQAVMAPIGFGAIGVGPGECHHSFCP